MKKVRRVKWGRERGDKSAREVSYLGECRSRQTTCWWWLVGIAVHASIPGDVAMADAFAR